MIWERTDALDVAGNTTAAIGKSVGSAALKIVEKVRRKVNTIPVLMEGTAKPDYAKCVKISADESIKEMIH
ncbi:hypothetical protein MKW92_027067 [Papaver armeniacum]|nr:hypothetical protein MKW92_027067 [Papaver armeniacum]